MEKRKRTVLSSLCCAAHPSLNSALPRNHVGPEVAIKTVILNLPASRLALAPRICYRGFRAWVYLQDALWGVSTGHQCGKSSAYAGIGTGMLRVGEDQLVV